VSYQLAWAAGYFEGEGCVTSNGVKTLNLEVSQTGDDGIPEDLQRFADTVGLGTIRGPYSYRAQMRPSYRWGASGRKAHAVMELLGPYLTHGGPKRRKYEQLRERVV
jgi:hypothetical protein